ncbi:MAG TPA: squalene synthase HpnC [Solirubrobacteraceae bacterium]|nr:squalene synthase HpnC [Solirubrobacteraceae bacterium]
MGARPALDDALAAPAGIESPQALLARARAENFTVASRLLPGRLRGELLALYGFARLVDELGDALPGERMAALDWLDAELTRAFEGRARHPLLVALGDLQRARALPRRPFERLIEANRADQQVSRYETFSDLLAYCDLSANPVGELVLHLLDRASPELIDASDRVCSALQVIEHLQDLREDYARGRIYLPAQDMARFGVEERELAGAHAGEALRALVAFQCDRARALLYGGEELLRALPPLGRIAVAGYIAGGHAALDAIAAGRFDVLAAQRRASAPARARWTALLLTRSVLPRAGGAARGQPTAAAPDLGARAEGAAGRAPIDAEQALRACVAITRREARNFYYGIRLLPEAKRGALCAVYAYARQLDDLGDSALPDDRRLAALAALERRLQAALSAPDREAPGGAPPCAWRDEDPVLIALAHTCSRYPLPCEDLHALIEGMRMDVRGERYETFDQLLRYCDRVAGTIGRLALAIYGVRSKRALAWAGRAASDLGIAMQLTNILRDLREDGARGRVYLPADQLERSGVLAAAGGREALASALAQGALAGPAAERMHALIAEVAEQAEGWYERGLSLTDQLDWRSRACVLAMCGIYRATLARIRSNPELPLRGRISLSAPRKGAIACAALVGLEA